MNSDQQQEDSMMKYTMYLLVAAWCPTALLWVASIGDPAS